MSEPEDLLRRLAEHRAARVPAYAAPARLDAARGRRPLLIGAIAAAVVVALVGAGFAFWPDDGSRSVHVGSPSTTQAPPTTTPPTTTAPSTTTTAPQIAEQCAPADAGIEPRTGGDPTFVALTTVEVQSSACVDEVTFQFGGNAPGWQVAYDPAATAALTGDATGLTVRFEPTARWELFQGPTDLVPSPPAEIRRVLPLSEGDGVWTWLIALDSERPFRVEVRDGDLVVQIFAAAPRPTTCVDTTQNFAVDFPGDWFAETGPTWGLCSHFASEPFVIVPSTDGFYGDVRAGVSPRPFDDNDHIDGEPLIVLSTREEMFGQRRARVTEIEWTDGLQGAGTRETTVYIDWGSSGTLRLTTSGLPGADYDAHRAVLEEMARSARPVN